MDRHHAIDYIEISVGDVAAAKAFYGAAFGWEFNDYGPEYAGIQGAGKEAGGLRRAADGAKPLVMLYSDSLQATRDAVTAAGGTIVEPISPYPGGHRFEFTDPDGNRLGVHTED
ncbi:MAG TPA: VOC family protein [Solirubrobacteraceae bacterium]|nr:VOC family protein [Solirubrobacteraceae bacterium]